MASKRDPDDDEESSSGGESLEELKAMSALALRASGLRKENASKAGGKADHKRRSLLVSGALSFFFGPWGWLYAGSFVEVIPAVLVYSLLVYILPSFVLFYLLAVSNLASAGIGVLYAWAYNQDGTRQRLTGKDKGDSKKSLPTKSPKTMRERRP
jgi:hypothetical protein